MTLKAAPFLPGRVKETAVSVAPFPCLHEAATQGHGVLVLFFDLGGLWLVRYALVKSKQAAFSPSLIIHHLKSLGDRSHQFSSESTLCQGHFFLSLSLSLLSILSLGNVDFVGFSLSPVDPLVRQTPLTCERRGGRFPVNRLGSGETLAAPLAVYTTGCTCSPVEYLPAVTSSLMHFDCENGGLCCHV